MLTDILFLVAGLAVLVVGGEFLVRGAVGIAKKLQVSTLVIGMTVVSFGTSAPELIVSVKAALDGHPAISIGNVVGSNIANIALVLAITVLIFPIIIDRDTTRRDWPIMMGASILFYAFGFDGIIQWWEGAILVVTVVAYTAWLITKSRKQSKSAEEEEEDESPNSPVYLTFVFLAIGLVGLYFGAEWLLVGAVSLATKLGMEEAVIAVTIVAFGTSVPELVTSAVAAYRKETDISVGNLIGSNLFNINVVIGITALVKEIDVNDGATSIYEYDMFWMLGVAALLLPLLIIGKKMGRIQGLILLLIYIAYISSLLFRMG